MSLPALLPYRYYNSECLQLFHHHQPPNPNNSPPLIRRSLTLQSTPPPPPDQQPLNNLSVVSIIVLLGFGISARASSASPTHLPPPISPHSHSLNLSQGNDVVEDDKLNAEFETCKSKTYALSVPLTIATLRGSIPPSWTKDFIQTQGKRVQFRSRLYGTLEDIFSHLYMPLSKGKVSPKSAVATDLVSVGDSWLNYAICKALIEPISGVENQDWFNSLSHKWKVYLRRNYAGELDPQGEIWAAPYQWGTMVIAYKQRKFQKHKLAPIEDWEDLWRRPELAGRIAMVDSPREVVGAVLKYMGTSYNTKNIELQVAGGRNAVQHNLDILRKQVRLFDSAHYLKAFGVGDVWVAVGWSSDVLPLAKRMSDVTVIVPKSGSSLWADLWVIPAKSRLNTNQIGRRVREPTPLIHQWIDLCSQTARALPFKQG
ncbi:SBP_bac_6 domain-containing protein [Cephalotus follicularis]|uniref:SBP_bac_6 domain-containing protein n=1 Tax=Cephalotus follicularis TaxID=3775 RepID=A0A1Q3DDF0_CEPFO|nr:SBP_bac_6 domain-containing protein [Cephalotus follicularis]